MSKIIRIAPDQYDQLYQEFLQSLRGTRISDGKITYTKTFDTVTRKATVFFSEKAWLKMEALINGFDKEVAWHGIAYRDEDPTKDNYYITDILVYPQMVTGATVNTDQKEYEKWLMELDDKTFNNLRMQGHSHVNMGVTPSAVDTQYYDDILDRLEDDMFYIFMIWNKKAQKTVKIYDFAKNVLFDTFDCEVKVVDGEYGLSKFVDEAKANVKDRVYTSNHNTYATSSYQTPKYTPPATTTKPAAAASPAPAVASSANKTNATKTAVTSSEKKLGRRKGKRKDKRNSGYSYCGNLYDGYGGYDDYGYCD